MIPYNRHRIFLGLTGLLALLGAASPAAAQTDSLTTPRPHTSWTSWTSDRIMLRAGDIVTVIIDEQTEAKERFNEEGAERRTHLAKMSLDANGEAAVGATGFDGRYEAGSRTGGKADRSGDLTGVLSARVVSVNEVGVAEIEGKKTVTIDGRQQEITLHGLVRGDDVSPDNIIHSSRLAEASIAYKGNKMNPKKGILGKILSILWPL